MSAYAIAVFIFILTYSFYMGVNDGSNAIATTVVTRAVQPRTAIFIAAFINFVVPIVVFLLGMLSVADNISYKLISNSAFVDISEKQAFSFVFSGLLGAIIWGGITFCLRIPNSTSHTLLGGIIGAGIAAFGFKSVQWTDYVLLNVVLMIVLAPVVGLILGFIIMKLVRLLARTANRGINKIMVLLQRINLLILASSFSSNNAQKSMGIFFLLGAVGLTAYSSSNVPIWIPICIASALTLGLLLGGYRVINTVGRKIYKLQPVHSVFARYLA